MPLRAEKSCSCAFRLALISISAHECHRSIDALENDMAAIRSEHENQHRTMQSQKSALDVIITDIGSLRLMGKETDPSRVGTPNLEGMGDNGDGEDKGSDDLPTSSSLASLNAAAKPFIPPSRISTPIPTLAQRQNLTKSSSSPLVSSTVLAAEKAQAVNDDIEMGELAEEPREVKVKKKAREDLEEGEASDSSSALSEVPDDI